MKNRSKLNSANRPAVQFRGFTHGLGYCLHKVPHLELTMSVYCDASGKVTAAHFSNEREVKPNSPGWKTAEHYAQRYISEYAKWQEGNQVTL